MAAGLVLFGSLWLPWFSTSEDEPQLRLGGVSGGDGATAWEVFATLDCLLVSAATAPFILSWIVMRGHALTWKPGEVTMMVGITGDGADPLQRDHPRRPGDSVDIGLGIGYFVGLVASVGLLLAGYLRQAFYGDAKKPPGVI